MPTTGVIAEALLLVSLALRCPGHPVRYITGGIQEKAITRIVAWEKFPGLAMRDRRLIFEVSDPPYCAPGARTSRAATASLAGPQSFSSR